MVQWLRSASADRQFPFTAWAHGHPRRVVLELLDDSVVDAASAPRDVEAGIGGKKFETMSFTQATYASGWDGNVVMDLPGDGPPSGDVRVADLDVRDRDVEKPEQRGAVAHDLVNASPVVE